MDPLRDPIWQFVGVVVAVVTAGVPATIWFLSKRRSRSLSRQNELIHELKRYHLLGFGTGSGKHKRRKSDGILLGNISSDFLNQFPVPISVLAAHLDLIYTPENFGSDDWLTVFRRLSEEGYFIPVAGGSPKRLGLDSSVNPGPKLRSWLRDTVRTKRSIQGLDD